MRLAVLISSYIVLAIMVLVSFGSIGTETAEASANIFLGTILLSVPIVLAVIYAHSQKPKGENV